MAQGVVLNRVATAIIVVIVVIVGGVIAITDHSTLTFREYVRDVAIAVGLLSVGYGLDSHSRP